MKKKIALLILTLVALTAILTACNSVATTIVVRWNESEDYTFNISLADFDTSENATGFFKKYLYENATYYKDLAISAQEVASLTTADELRPENAGGTYTYSLRRSSGTSQGEVTAKQTLYVQYKTETLQSFECWDELKKDFAVAADSEENPFTNHEGLTTLKSITETSAKFADDTNQRPVSSSTKLNGFYLGKLHQEISKYEVVTEYDFDKNVAKVTVTENGVEGEVKEQKLSVAKSRNFIDSNQILTYLRSLEKSATSFQDNPTVTVYNPLTNATAIASFNFSYDQKVVLNNNGENFYTSLNAVGVNIGGMAFMMQENLPDRLASKDKDVYNTVGDTKYSKYTTVRFRVGYCSYELDSYDQDVLTALNAKEESK